MRFEVKEKSRLPAVIAVLLFPIFFYLGLRNSIVFYEMLPKTPPKEGFLIFYQPSCIHCIEEIPEVKKLIKKGYKVSAVNVLEARELASEFGVKVTPTIVIFPQKIKVEGSVSAQRLEELARSKALELFERGSACSVGGETC